MQDHPTVDGSAVATITRDQRDALHYEIREYVLDGGGTLGDFSSCLKWPGSGAEARERWQRMARAARLLEDLGWDAQADRDVYPLTMEAGELERLVRHRLEETEGTLAGRAETFAQVRGGHDPWADPALGRGPGEGSIEKDLDDLRSLTDRDLEVVGACRAILGQLEATR